jgi:hypothetical protein
MNIMHLAKPTPYGQSDNDIRLLKYKWLSNILTKKRLTVPTIFGAGFGLLYGLKEMGVRGASESIGYYESAGWDMEKPFDSLVNYASGFSDVYTETLLSSQSHLSALAETATYTLPLAPLALTIYASHRMATSLSSGDGRDLSEAFYDRGPYKDLMHQASSSEKKLFKKSDFHKQPSKWALYRPAQVNNFFNRLRNDGAFIMQRLGGALAYSAFTGKNHSKTYFDEPTNIEVNLLHLAALLGSDDSPIAKRLKMSDALSDPAYQDVFNNAGDITQALAPNITNLKDFATRASKSLGEVSQYLFKNSVDIDACLQEWSSLTASCFTQANKEIQENNMRHGITKYVVDMQLSSANGTLRVKDVDQMITRLNAFEHIRNYDTPKAPLSDMMKQIDDLKSMLLQARPANAKSRDIVALPVTPGLSGQWQELPKPLLLEKVFAEHYGTDVPFSVNPNEMFVNKFSDKLASTILKSPMMDNTPEHERKQLANDLRDQVLQRTAMNMSQTTVKDKAKDIVSRFRPTSP